MNSKTQGYILFLSHAMASIILAIYFSIYPTMESSFNHCKKGNINLDIGALLYRSVKDSIETILLIGGFITLFFNLNFVLEYFKVYSLLYNTLYNLFGINKDLTKGLLYGFFEITNGTVLVSKSQTLSTFYKLLACTFIIS